MLGKKLMAAMLSKNHTRGLVKQLKAQMLSKQWRPLQLTQSLPPQPHPNLPINLPLGKRNIGQWTV